MAKTGLALGLALLLSIVSVLFPINSVVASPDEVKWSRVNIPAEGRLGGWVLAGGSDVEHLTMAIDGTLYCYANPTGTDYTLFISIDDGYSWAYTGQIKDEIVDIATSPDDANVLYYATASNVYKSTDAGGSFIKLSLNPGGAGSNNIEITSIDVTLLDGNNIVAVGTRDTGNSEYGGVYILEEGGLFPSWVDTDIGSYDVYAVFFSPNFTADDQLVAVATDETDTIISTKIGDGWGETIGDATIEGLAPVAATIAFPSDYDASVFNERHVLFVAIDTGSNNGDVYMISGVAPGSLIATDLDVGSAYGLSSVDVTGLAVTGDTAGTRLLAGAAGSAEVYYSIDGGTRWRTSTKPPTGGSETYVVMAADFAASGRACAATSGYESAFSYTGDGGANWSQIGLIDTGISRIIDLAPSPNYGRDDTLFMLTWGSEHSLWLSASGGARWERIFTSLIDDVDQIDRVELSPQYGNGSQAVFLAGKRLGNPAIWKSVDNGESFVSRTTHDPDTGTPFDIKSWTVVDDNTLFIGSNGLVYRTTRSGSSYPTKAVAGNQSLKSIALSPSYDEDENILVGNTNGWVYWSDNGGKSFEPLPLDATSPPLTGNINVTFDPQFSSNDTVYAASDTPDKGIYRFIIDKSTSWESIDGTLPENGMIGQLKVSANGTLYAANSMADGGMERCLNPTYPLGPKFETVIRGLDDGAKLSGLWLRDNQLWSIDTANSRVMTFSDSLATPVILTSPPDQGAGIGTIVDYSVGDIRLDWEALSGATEYKWQLNYDSGFSTEPVPFEGETKASSARLPELELATTYYWRVRATEPVLSPWSDKWSFTTSLGTEIVAPHLQSPEAGASNVEVKPLFQWTAIAGAGNYELLVSSDDSFAEPLIVKTGDYALPANAWQCDVRLDYDTAYYWKVRAASSDSYSAWSAVGVFTTMAPLSPQSSSPPEPSPLSPNPTTPDWANRLIHLGGALLVVMVAILVVVIILTVKVFRR